MSCIYNIVVLEVTDKQVWNQTQCNYTEILNISDIMVESGLNSTWLNRRAVKSNFTWVNSDIRYQGIIKINYLAYISMTIKFLTFEKCTSAVVSYMINYSNILICRNSFLQ